MRALRPRATSCSELVARTRAARRSRAERTARRRQSQGCGSGEGRRRLRCSAGAVAAQVPTLKAADDAKVPSISTWTRVTAAHGRSRRFRYPEVAPDVSVPRLAQDRYVAWDAFASATGAINSIARSCRRTWRSRQARTPGHPSRDVYWRVASRTTRTDFATVTTGTIALAVSRTAFVALAPRFATPTRVLKAHARALLIPKRLDGAHEAIRAYFMLYGSFRPKLSEACPIYAAS